MQHFEVEKLKDIPLITILFQSICHIQFILIYFFEIIDSCYNHLEKILRCSS